MPGFDLAKPGIPKRGAHTGGFCTVSLIPQVKLNQTCYSLIEWSLHGPSPGAPTPSRLSAQSVVIRLSAARRRYSQACIQDPPGGYKLHEAAYAD